MFLLICAPVPLFEEWREQLLLLQLHCKVHAQHTQHFYCSLLLPSLVLKTRDFVTYYCPECVVRVQQWLVLFLITCQISADRQRSCKKYIELGIQRSTCCCCCVWTLVYFFIQKYCIRWNIIKTLNNEKWKEDAVIIFVEDTFCLMCMLKAWVKINRQYLLSCIRLNSSLPVGIISWKTHCIIWIITFLCCRLD